MVLHSYYARRMHTRVIVVCFLYNHVVYNHAFIYTYEDQVELH